MKGKNQMKNFLREVYKKPADFVSQRKLYLCVDPGSTQTRSVAQYVNSDNEVVLASEGRNAINSQYVNILNSMSADTSREPLYKNMEFMIQYDVIDGLVKVPKTAHFARSYLADKYRQGGQTFSIDSTTEKGRQLSTYNTILSNVALYCLGDDLYTNTYSDVYHVSLMLAIPPMENTLSSSDSRFETVLCGREWNITLPRIKRSFKVIIDELTMVEEPVAAAVSAIGRGVVDKTLNISFLDCGGRSQGWVPFVDKVCSENVYSVQGNAGQVFLDFIASEIKRLDQVSAPSPQAILKAMDKGGKLMSGAKETSLIQAYNNALRFIAASLIATLKKGIAASSRSIEDFQEHIFSGRIFTNPIRDENKNIISDQLIDVLYEEFNDLPEGVVLRVNPTPNPILDGLALLQAEAINRELHPEDDEYEEKGEDEADEF